MPLPKTEATITPDLDGSWDLVSTNPDTPEIRIRVALTADEPNAPLTWAAYSIQQEIYRARSAGLPEDSVL